MRAGDITYMYHRLSTTSLRIPIIRQHAQHPARDS
jgi:hypothetical protein